jgi:hypothetical protein
MFDGTVLKELTQFISIAIILYSSLHGTRELYELREEAGRLRTLSA